MTSPLRSIVDQGTRLWLDSIDPEEIKRNKALGASGATSNPIIIADLIKTGRFDDDLGSYFDKDLSDEDIAWAITDKLVSNAQASFHDTWKQTECNDGWVSFELDPLLEDHELAPALPERISRYIELGKKWAAGHDNRMIKVPATEAGLGALEEIAAAGIALNVTLIFSQRQYEAAREAVWRGAQRRPGGLDTFKSVYSIFISRVDVYTEKHLPDLSAEAQGQVGIVNAKRLWQDNQAFWADKNLKLDQEIIFASTGTKKPEDPADKYVGALVGSDIQTNPPATNAAVKDMGKTYTRTIEDMPPKAVLDQIDALVDPDHLETTLLNEGTAKFADPHKNLIELIGKKRAAIANT
ncbi:transaldolase family protein [Mucisphaera sp.]|uniref:transaldolase family protein n=1 Tax=Mucisphaera sp. TaxID=2913024 RepID=UPI003D0A8ACE